MKKHTAELIQEYGPFPGAEQVHGLTFDGRYVWFASGDRLSALDPADTQPARAIEVPAHAGTAFDGEYLFQIAEDIIQKIDPATGKVLATIPAPGGGGDSGLAWAGLQVGQIPIDDDYENEDGKGGFGAVPEPSTWALMIAGFGLAGLALRRRRAQPAL